MVIVPVLPRAIESMSYRLSQWIIAALLVVSQTVLLVHQADIDHHLDAEDCQVCLLGAGHDDVVTTDVGLKQLHFNVPLAFVTAGILQFPLRFQHKHSRAPPFKTFTV